ncbi:SpoIID/LytB domain-containing protein [Kamptonema formosum]|uniref:SpoIID/LytB domain-containing protein n=1 Tax=Kamptonema formosum TaxID=331992 RepID=UPI00034A72A7|nr:SpoIID/LytB domain-containing protein [Oscillatoria sp. PCC 10802]
MQQTGDALTQIVVPIQPKRRASTGKWLTYLSGTAISSLWLLGLTGSLAPAQTPRDIELQVGVVQRFGAKPNDELTLKARWGDRLTLNFNSNGEPVSVKASEVKLEIQMEPLPSKGVDERLVLGTYRSFESAEETATQWRAKGIEVEIAQPRRWQVWAKRDAYSSPLVRRLLLQSLQAQGDKKAYLETNIVEQAPAPTWTVSGKRYSAPQLEITAGTGRIQFKEGKDKKSERLYPGILRLQPNAYGTYTLVNQVPLETYLRGVVPHEIGGEAPYASVEAQAILARTYVLRNLRRFATDGYQICANTNCQVYKGLTGTWADADRAVAATAGKVLTYKNELVDALYYSTSGGVTAPFSDIWHGPERPYLQTVIDAPTSNVWDLSGQSLENEENFRRFISLKKGFNEEGKELFRWREESSLENMNKDLRRYLEDKKHPLANFKTIQQIQVVQRSRSGRALNMTVQTDAGTVELEKDEILRAFYAPLSTLFYVEPVYKKDSKDSKDSKSLKGYAFVGGGFGHGVGMSQIGSYKLAKMGWPSERILSFYYPGTQILPLSDSITFWRDPQF